MKYAKILLVADQPEDKIDIALQHALRMAEPGAKIHVYSFVYDAFVGKLGYFEDAEVENLRLDIIAGRCEWLAEQVAPYQDGDIKIIQEVVWSDRVGEAVIKLCDDKRFDLVIKTGHRTERLWYRPTDWQLLDRCSAPVYIAAQKKWKPSPTILATVDIANRNPVQKKLNHKVMRHALHMAEHLDASLHLCHIVEVSKVLKDLDIMSNAQYMQHFNKRHGKTLQSFVDKYALPEKCVHIHTGQAHRKIPSIANSLHASLVVMGSSGRPGILNRIIGTTAEQVLSVLRTDVLSVRA